MKLILSRDADEVSLTSRDNVVTLWALLTLLGALLSGLLDFTHPFASLECVRHELHGDRSAAVGVGVHRQSGEDNDCELLVRRRWSAAEEDYPATPFDEQASTLRAGLLNLVGVRERLYSFEISAVVSKRPGRLSTETEQPTTTALRTHGSEAPLSIGDVHLGRGGRQRHALHEEEHERGPPAGQSSRLPSRRPSRQPSRLPLVLRDRVGHNYTVFTFDAESERSACRRAHRALERYLSAAATQGQEVHLSLSYDTSRWEEAVGLACSLVAVLLGWVWPCSEAVRLSSRANVFELRRTNLFAWPTLHLAVTLDAVSHARLVEAVALVPVPRSGGKLARRRTFGLELLLRASAVPARELEMLRRVGGSAGSADDGRPASLRALQRLASCTSRCVRHGRAVWSALAARAAPASHPSSPATPLLRLLPSPSSLSSSSSSSSSSSLPRLVAVPLGFGLAPDPAVAQRTVAAVAALLLDQRSDALPDNSSRLAVRHGGGGGGSGGGSGGGGGGLGSNGGEAMAHPTLGLRQGGGGSSSGDPGECRTGTDGLWARSGMQWAPVDGEPNPSSREARGSGLSSDGLFNGAIDAHHSPRQVSGSGELSLSPVFSPTPRGEGGSGGGGSSGGGEGRCIVCLTARARVVFFPCKHLKVCRVCADECASCPLCRSPIDERHVVFC